MEEYILDVTINRSSSECRPDCYPDDICSPTCTPGCAPDNCDPQWICGPSPDGY